jgi:hypothetical protein
MRQVMRVLLTGFEPLNNPSKRDDVNDVGASREKHAICHGPG